MNGGEASAGPVVASGSCFALFAYDVGLGIELDEADRRITALKERARIRHKRRAPRYFDYEPPPLRVIQEAEPVSLGRWTTAPGAECVLFDFGGVLVTYRIALSGSLDDLVTLSEELYDCAPLLRDSRERVEALVGAVSPAVKQPAIGPQVENYSIFQIEAFEGGRRPDELCTTDAPRLARLLRSERSELSAGEVADVVSHRISFGADDVTVIDWDGALLYDRDADDVRAVLEFANVELLQMRALDARLDEALGDAYEQLSRRQRSIWPGFLTRDLSRIGQSQVDGAILFEGVNNALKLLGDQYLARVYRLASERFHLAEWDATILRKLETLDSIYEKVSTVAANRRIELLEWIIILLIALEIVLFTG